MNFLTKETTAKFNIQRNVNGWGNITTFNTDLGTFQVQRKSELDYNGNPTIVITPMGYVNQLPKIAGFRRNNNQQHYTTDSYNFDETFEKFITALNIEMEKGNMLYHNN